MQYSYLVTSDGPINERNLSKLELGPEDYNVYGRQQDGKFLYLMWLTQKRRRNKGIVVYQISRDGK